MRALTPLQVQLSLEPGSGLVSEAWLRAVSINGRALLPSLISQWLKQAADRGAQGTASIFSLTSLLSALLPWLSVN